uniref:RING-H2 zinc finger protein RHA1a-like n=1 Tax=Nicotiana sylvestris TaxID=4096 RepID=A0A1U7WKJ3_NICSY|nr:PREDICTED: RING-H2 zinc finger protein RHA1a-like [Nicotiana sylvestris]
MEERIKKYGNPNGCGDDQFIKGRGQAKHPITTGGCNCRAATTPHDHNNELRIIRRFEHDLGTNLDSVECAICLCKIEEGEEVRELRCDHVFHRVCLDRWMNCGRNMTCPLCRNHLMPNAVLFSELNHHQEVIRLDFLSGRSRDLCQWWLR